MSSASEFSRRSLLRAGLPAAGGLIVAGGGHAASGGEEPEPGDIPRLEYVYTAHVGIAKPVDFGDTPDGHRRVIPITGGTFEGPKIRGLVLPGGADWNLSRSDGATVVEASYYMKTDDGVVIRITNAGVGGPPLGLRFTTPRFEAPKGKYDWLNRSVFVGTLGFEPGSKEPIRIRVFRVA
ncbi:hypothetical protein OJF2_35340 [Aquisphaera giovannonii]|uniref:UPF0311 protein OJF2_35340 n=1 Tax=Aquisphaera giovannonii TaxID=406548 RepID=A0A5B9W464_9BACT|nr:DUF3237 domain-containing protein [Aquisphaera giovannonii]QEH34989.1 hypothetical protein OJF2_35340 [Aquisphaera giovannonii]